MYGSKFLSTGRVVVLRDGHFRWAVALILKPAPTHEQVKHFYVLSLVDPATKDKKNDVEVQAVPPQWPPAAQSLVVEDGVYEVCPVPMTSIALVTSRTLKVDIDAIIERHLMSPMNDVVAQLGALANEWANNNHIPEVDWARMRLLEFQDLLSRRNTLVKRVEGSACVLCEEFEPHVCSTTLFGSLALNVHV